MSSQTSSSENVAYSRPDRLPAASVENAESSIQGNSAAMRRLLLQVQRIGPYFRTVLLRGEPGTEKEQVARRLHHLSQASAGQFVMCHAATLEDALPNTSPGDALEWLIGMARGGTLLLDGVEELPVDAQAKMLRILRRHEFAESGGTAPPRPAVRVIASTTEELRVLACAGRFGLELYQRLATVEIVISPLRERTEDLPALVGRLLERLGKAGGEDTVASGISEQAMQRLVRYGWPGNAVEMENVLRGAMLQADGGIVGLHHLPALEENAFNLANTAAESVRLQDVVERHVLRILKDCGGNKVRAAEKLGISRSTLYRMLEAGAVA
ncbi:MAG: sigma 54-interacting transcriptional regulator [Acidobacteriota bacterium]|nr:sigma 54-interacting transcriptional regulator [Acidobacteriota bacterium]